MNPSRLEGVWISLQFANPAAEGGGGPSQPTPSLWAVPAGTGTSSQAAPLARPHPGDTELLLPGLSYTQLRS